MKKSIFLSSLAAATILFTACGGGGSGSGSSSSNSSSSISGDAPVIVSPNSYDVVAGRLKSFTLTTGENVIHNSGNPAFKFAVVEGSVADINEDTGDILYSVTDSPAPIKVTATRVEDGGSVTSITSAPYTISFNVINPDTITAKKPMQTGSDIDVATNLERNFVKDAEQNVVDPNGLVWGDSIITAKTDLKTYLEAQEFCEGSLTPAGTWRVPTLDELLDLVDYSKPPFKEAVNPPMISDVFTKSMINVWGTAENGDKIFLSENSGTITYAGDVSVAVRCVKGDEDDAKHLIYSDLSEETYDINTGLQWKKPSTEVFTAAAATSYCETAGYRLPSINELRSVVEHGTIAPIITGGNRQLISSTPYIDANGTNPAGNTWRLVLRENGTITFGAGTEGSRISCVKDID